MILRSALTVTAFALLACTALPAQADVLEVGMDGQVQWIAGPVMEQPGLATALVAGEPLSEVPADVATLLPEYAVANTQAHAAGVPVTYAAAIQNLAHRFDLSPALLEALVWQESRWRADAVSPVGARGLAQLMPGTARDLGVNPDDPFANLEGGARYLREQLDRFDGDLERALAAYNAGPGRVIRSGGVPNIRETRNYVTAIMGRLANHSRSPE
ncbi:MAG: lytic transglycosylase domain-containing protein [Erythrobacter sp.]|nr:MAG: lytic transglycosylase domain-containing protein [Erythrobacter sp.]